MDLEQQQRRKIRILSIDGGGMRGLIPAHMLVYLEQALKEKSKNPEARLADYFDVVAGTSVGGLIAVMLFTTGDTNQGKPLFTAEQVRDFIAEKGKEIFKIPYPYKLFKKLRGIMTPRYSTRSFEKILKEHLVKDGRELTLSDTLKPLVIPCYDLTNAGAFCFYKNGSLDFKLWEICRATSAVPSFFRPVKVTSVDSQHEFTAVDGGLVVNNPTAAAITHVFHDRVRFPEVRGVEDLLVLSLGTGQFDRTYRHNEVEKWGAFQWAKPVARIIIDGISNMVDHTVSMAFRDHRESYLRVQMSGLPDKALLAMDDPSQGNVARLKKVSQELLKLNSMEHVAFGGRRKLPQTISEKLDWFAEQLVSS